MKNQIWIIVLAAVLISCEAPKKPNFVFIIGDDISYNDFGCYGNDQVKTPNIDSLAARGMLFTNLYLTISSCSPSRNSIITGRYPHNTGAAELHTEPPIDMISFPELMREQGYYTALSGKFHIGEYARRGFEFMETDLEKVGDGGEEQWLPILKNRPQNRPFFLWYAAYDAHRDWGSNEFSGTHIPEGLTTPAYLDKGFETKNDLAKFYDEISRLDYYVGEVVKELKRQEVLDHTVIIVMSDNGRPFPQAKTRVNDRGLKSPFVVHWPEGIAQPKTFDGLVSAIDIAPTLFDLAGIDPPASFQGKSFSKVFSGSESRFRDYLFAEQNWHDYEAHQRMVRSKDYLYILNSRPELTKIGPADAVSSPAHKALLKLKDSNTISPIQADIFQSPRPSEELFDCVNDPEQFVNVAQDPSLDAILLKHRGILLEWMAVTGDNIPDELTKDWYLRIPGYQKTKDHGIRGEMPGEVNDATKINEKGKF